MTAWERFHAANPSWTYTEYNLFAEFVTGLPGPGEISIASPGKAIFLPAWREVQIDMEEVLSGHTATGARAIQSGIKDVLPKQMSAKEIEQAIRQAYRNSSKIGPIKNGTVKLEGTASGLRIQMYLNIVTKTIETAWPKW